MMDEILTHEEILALNEPQNDEDDVASDNDKTSLSNNAYDPTDYALALISSPFSLISSAFTSCLTKKRRRGVSDGSTTTSSTTSEEDEESYCDDMDESDFDAVEGELPDDEEDPFADERKNMSFAVHGRLDNTEEEEQGEYESKANDNHDDSAAEEENNEPEVEDLIEALMMDEIIDNSKTPQDKTAVDPHETFSDAREEEEEYDEEKLIVLNSIDQPEEGSSIIDNSDNITTQPTLAPQSDDTIIKEEPTTTNKRWSTSSQNTDLSGSWCLQVTPEFLTQYDSYLSALGFNYFTRSIALKVIHQTYEVMEQMEDGRVLKIVGTNPKGVWDRTLIASSGTLIDKENSPTFNDNEEEEEEVEEEKYVHDQHTIPTADGESATAEAWWEENGTVHRSLLIGAGDKYGGGDFESKRYLDDNDCYICESVFHRDGHDAIELTWRFTRRKD